MHLNLRSYRNAHFGGDDPTVLFLGFHEVRSVELDHAVEPLVRFHEVRSVGRVAEKRTEADGRHGRAASATTIELLLSGVDTQPIADACRAERERAAPDARTLGVTSRTKHHHVTVFVPEPGVVRVEWNGGLYRELVRHVDEADPRRVDLDAELGSLSPEERAARLVLRGQRLAAYHVAREELGLGTREAREWVREAARRAA